MPRPKKIVEVVKHETLEVNGMVGDIVMAEVMAEKAPEIVVGEKDPTKLCASDNGYTHVGSPVHKAWLAKHGGK